MQSGFLARNGKKLGGICAVLALALLTENCGGGDSGNNNPPPGGGTALTVTLTSVATGFVDPLGLVAANDNSNRLFVLEQRGTIRIIQNGSALSTPFLDIQSKVESGGELGLLGMAFHPQFSQNRLFYLNYTRLSNGQLESVIAEYAATAVDPNRADPNSETILLVLNQEPDNNHKGGQLAFGPDGFLYIAFGDGGGAGDIPNNAQNTQELLGKILRIDVNGTNGPNGQYGIPADNPFASGTGGRPEIWALGLRNPWRFSFDTDGGRLFAGDVGQNNFEEVDIITRGGNYGWRIMEGNHCFNPASGCNQNGLILPITEYSHSEGSAVIGGFVYRGSAIPQLRGSYVFSDLSGGAIWRLQESQSGTWSRTTLNSNGRTISSFGQDQAGELYVVDYDNGVVLRITP
jgi:glucose/arabinose dehydrogenase